MFRGSKMLSSSLGTDILSLDALALSKAIQTQQVTCENLMEQTLARIESVNPKCNAIIMLQDKEELLEQARQADQSSIQGGWLRGIPMAIKDVSNVKGIPTTMGGSPFLTNWIPDASDAWVDRLCQAGAIIIGKTNTPEHAVGSHTYNERWGTTRNPFNLSCSAGGSSGGAGVAVTTRMLCVADGTDMMGSLRNPAGWNNIYSHRPTAGMISPDPKGPLEYPISTPGPMARTPTDCAMLLETMAGKDVFDASTVLSPSTPLKETVTIGWCGDWGGRIPMESGVLPLCREYLKQVESKNDIVIQEVDKDLLFDLSKLWTSWTCIRAKVVSESFATLLGREHCLDPDSPLKPAVRMEIQQGFQTTSAALEEAKQLRDDFVASLEKLWSTCDVLALPSAQVFAFPSEWTWPETIDGVDMDTYHRWMQVCIPVSLGGLPCTTVPAGFDPISGTPMGLQVFGPRHQDTKVLQVACRLYDTLDYASQVQPLEDGTSTKENAIWTHKK
eukprot:Nitzschia sp. Nitz4//NODE_293_length_29386_cov_71.949235//27056//28558//NITZ4_additional_000041-RA//-1//CDS//3329531845//7894//frame0